MKTFLQALCQHAHVTREANYSGLRSDRQPPMRGLLRVAHAKARQHTQASLYSCSIELAPCFLPDCRIAGNGMEDATPQATSRARADQDQKG